MRKCCNNQDKDPFALQGLNKAKNILKTSQ